MHGPEADHWLDVWNQLHKDSWNSVLALAVPHHCHLLPAPHSRAASLCPLALTPGWLLAVLPQDELHRCLTDRSVDARQRLDSLGLTAESCECVLALRGLLAYGVLEHCLQMRPLVDYGINRWAAAGWLPVTTAAGMVMCSQVIAWGRRCIGRNLNTEI